MWRNVRRIFLAIVALHSVSGTNAMAEPPRKPVDYSKAIANFDQAIRAEMAEHALHGMAVALFDDQQVDYTAGFGNVNADSIFRAARFRSCSMRWR